MLVIAVVGFVLVEAGSLVINRLQAADVASQAATEAGIVYLASNGSEEQAKTQAEQFVKDQNATFVGLSVNQAARTITVTVEKVAPTRVVHKIEALKSLTRIRATETVPLRT